MADIERLQRTLENVPESRVEEVTTVEAVRMLTSEIHAMQAKGYSLPLSRSCSVRTASS